MEETLVTAVQTMSAGTSPSARRTPAGTAPEGDLTFLPSADLDEPMVTPTGAATIDRIRALPWACSPSVGGDRLLVGEPSGGSH